MKDYVATAAAEKRLREILAARFGEHDIEDLAQALLSSDVQIEYKPRLKAVLVTIPLPDKATSAKAAEQRDNGEAYSGPIGNVPPELVDSGEITVTNSGGTAIVPVAEVREDLDLPTPTMEPHLFAPTGTGDCACGDAKFDSIHVWPQTFGTFTPKAYGVDYDDTYGVG